MRKPAVLIIPVERITWEGLDALISLDADWFTRWLKEQPGLEFTLARPITGNIHLERHDENILVRGRLRGELNFTCSRCLESFSEPLAADFDLLLTIGRPPVASQEHELDRGELDEDYFLGDDLDLNAILREQILLTLPLKPLCREDCDGLCRHCGANLNRDVCSCTAAKLSSSFAALEKLKTHDS